MNDFDKKMASLVIAAATAGVAILLCGCTPAGILAAGGVGTAAGVSASTVASAVSVANSAYEDGQLFCSLQSSVVAVVDASTNQAYTVTNKPASTVAKVCAAVFPTSVPVVPPSNPTMVPAVAVLPSTTSTTSTTGK